MKKQYEKAKIEIIAIECDEIIMTSSNQYATDGVYDVNNPFDEVFDDKN